MTSTALVIIAVILAVLAVIALFFPRTPAVVAAYAALVCANLAGAYYTTSQVLIFWGIATTLVLGLRFLQPKVLVEMRQGQGYVAGGAFIGALLGVFISPTAASIILCSAVTAFLGAMAYMRTPKSPRLPIGSRSFVSYLAAKGLPAVVTSVMAVITIISVL